jgi:hypothetical protein
MEQLEIWKDNWGEYDFDERVHALHGLLEVACMELAESQVATSPSERIRAFRNFSHWMNRSVEMYNRLTEND